jgi:hypothetical protein
MSAWEDTSLTTLIASWSLVFVSSSEIAGNCTRARHVRGWALVCVGSLRTASNCPRAGRMGGAAVARSFPLRQDTRCIARHAIECTLTASRLLRAGVMLLFATQTSITEALRIRYPNTRQRAGPKETFSPSPLRRRSRQVRYGGRWFSSAKNLFHNFTKRRKRRILLWLDRRHVLWFDRRSLMWLDRSILL